MKDIPDYAELPEAAVGGRSGWGVFGDADNVGLLNLQEPDKVLAASRLIRRGKVFPLDAGPMAFAPPAARIRGFPRHTLLHRSGEIGFDDVIDNFYPQVSSQWDALAHVAYRPDAFYNGASEADILAGRRNTIEHWAKRGIVGRAVLLDIARTLSDDGRSYSPGDPVALTVDDLEMARTRAGVEYEPGDVILMHTGFAAWYRELPESERLSKPAELSAVGVAHSEEIADYLWNSHVAAIATDTFAVEVWPPDWTDSEAPFGFLHRVLIGLFGMALGELFWLQDLAADCAADRIYEMFFVAAPMCLVGGIGSPANSIAIK
jgi:kynurenine formamidase